MLEAINTIIIWNYDDLKLNIASNYITDNSGKLYGAI